MMAFIATHIVGLSIALVVVLVAVTVAAVAWAVPRVEEL